jgi:hypothetical protein
LFLNCLIFSLSATQNLCSSSIIISHKFLKSILSLSNLCVHIIKSISQQASFFKISASFLGVSSLVNTAIFTQKFLNLSIAFSKCSYAKTIKGAINIDCFLFKYALYIVLKAISVFQNHTSPTSNLSIGVSFSISFNISQIAWIWSGVWIYEKLFLNFSSFSGKALKLNAFCNFL